MYTRDQKTPDIFYAAAALVDAGLEADLEAGFFADFGFDAAAFALVAGPPAFFAPARFTVVVFFVGVDFLATAVFLVVALFLGAAFAVVVVDFFAAGVVFLGTAAFLGAAAVFAPVDLPKGFLTVVEVFLVLVAAAAVTGFLFSFATSGLFLGVSLTLPWTPFGRVNLPFSAPLAIALLMLVSVAAVISSLYFSSMNFLIVGRETPVLASSLFATMHSVIISMKLGCVLVAGAFLAAVVFLVVVAGIGVVSNSLSV